MRKRETRADFWLLEPLSCFLFSLTQTATLAWTILITVISSATSDSYQREATTVCHKKPWINTSAKQLHKKKQNQSSDLTVFTMGLIKKTTAVLFDSTVNNKFVSESAALYNSASQSQDHVIGYTHNTCVCIGVITETQRDMTEYLVLNCRKLTVVINSFHLSWSRIKGEWLVSQCF